MSDSDGPQAIQVLDDLLSGVVSSPSPVKTPSPTASMGAQPATAITQAAPGTTPPVKSGPQTPTMPTVVPRGTVVGSGANEKQATIDLSTSESFEANLAKLLVKDLELAQHDRSMAIALFQTHLDRAEVLDTMQLSMPVATVIGDNTGATLKSLELAMKAGERVHKVAELLVAAQKNGDNTALAALKLKSANKDDWSGDDIPE